MENDIDIAQQGKRLRELRGSTCLTRRAFSRKHDFPLGTLQNWENGKYKSGISKKNAAQLINAFLKEGIVCNKDWLLYGTGIEPYQTLERNSISRKSSKSTLQAPKEQSIVKQAMDNMEKNKINEQLCAATLKGDINTVKHFILERGAMLHLASNMELHLFNDNENTLLHLSAEKNHADIGKFLINEGINIDARNRRKQTPLHLACYQNHVDFVEFLLDHGANVDAVEDEGGTPLSWAAYTGNTQIAKLLLTHRAHIHSCDIRSNTPLHWACFKGHLSMIEFLIKKGADPHKKNHHSQKPIDLAIQNGQLEAVIFLQDY